jgi:phage/plasmid-like protein (TIGR03299 family)
MTAAVETMMYTGQLPWHGLGKYVGDEPLLAYEAMRQAQLDWEVDLFPMVAKVPAYGGIDDVPVPENFAVVRDFDKRVLGVVGKRYEPLQNSQAFDFMDTLVGPGRMVRYHTAGSLRGGRRVWMLATVDNLAFEVVPGDPIEPYLLLYTGHDGKTCTIVKLTEVRVVCQNTATAALQGSGASFKIRHTANAAEKLMEAQAALGYATEAFAQQKELYTAMAHVKLTCAQWADFLDEMVDLPEKEGRGRTRATNKRVELTCLFEGGLGTDIPGVRGTAWGAYNAITEYTTHHSSVKLGGLSETDSKYDLRKRERRLDSAWFGTGEKFNAKALDTLGAMV